MTRRVPVDRLWRFRHGAWHRDMAARDTAGGDMSEGAVPAWGLRAPEFGVNQSRLLWIVRCASVTVPGTGHGPKDNPGSRAFTLPLHPRDETATVPGTGTRLRRTRPETA